MATGPDDIATLTNADLLGRLHATERTRVLHSAEATSQQVMTDPWPAGYEALVAEAQRRGLCL